MVFSKAFPTPRALYEQILWHNGPKLQEEGPIALEGSGYKRGKPKKQKTADFG
jgi:hypothetical protein